MRTTSSLESMNAQLGRLFTIKHPNIFRFIEELKPHEFRKATDMLRLIANRKPQYLQRKRKRCQEREEKIQHFSEMLQSNTVSVGTFLDVMSNKTVLPDSGMFFFQFSIISDFNLLLFSIQLSSVQLRKKI